MQTSHFTIDIHAPKEKVWKTMLEQDTYSQWTAPFNPGSTYEGNWEEGSTMIFTGTGENGKKTADGMYSQIKENRQYEFVSIEHLGIIKGGVVDTTSDEVKKWTPAFENYTFSEADGATTLSIDLDVGEDYKEMFDDTWPKALQILKEMCEK